MRGSYEALAERQRGTEHPPHAETGETQARGEIPPWSVAVTATRPRSFPGGEFGLPCALVVKRLTEGQRHDKAQLEGILRQHGVTGA